MRTFSLCLAWMILVGALRAAEPPEVVTVTGEPFRAELTAVDAAWQFTFAETGQARTVTGDELVRWGAAGDPAMGWLVVLADGGMIATQSAQLDEETIRGASEMFGKWQLPIDSVAGLVLRLPGEPRASGKLIDRIVQATGRDDRLWLDNGDQLSGTLTSLDATRAELKTDAGPLEVKLDSVAAIVFDPSLASERRPEGLHAIVGLRDGSRVIAERLEVAGADARIRLAAGGELTAARAWVTLVQMLGGRAVYLSELEPSSFRHLPLLNLEWPYKNDRNVTGGMLRAGGQAWLKGLGMHSPARITYDLGGEYQSFEAEVAIDDSVGPRGSVLFRVFADLGDGEWQLRATSPIQRGGATPHRLKADLAGAERISLLVDFADRGDELDHADWLDARLIKAEK